MGIIGKLKDLIFGAPPEPRFSERDVLAAKQRAETLAREFSESLSNAANSKSRRIREERLQIAHEWLVELKKLANKFPFLQLTNLQEIETRIIAIETETRSLSYNDAAVHGASTASAVNIQSNNDEPMPVFEPQRSHVENYRIQEPKPSARWVALGEAVQVGNFTLPGGMFYVGSGLRSQNGNIEPALINPKLAIAQNAVDESLRLTDYWPSYEGIQPEARRA